MKVKVNECFGKLPAPPSCRQLPLLETALSSSLQMPLLFSFHLAPSQDKKMQSLSSSVKVFKAVPNRNPVLGLVCCSWSPLLQGGELPHCAYPQIRWTWQCALGQGPLPCSKRPGEQSAKLFLSALKHSKATGKCCVYSHTSCWRQLLPWFLWTCPLLHFAVRQLGSGRLKPSFLKHSWMRGSLKATWSTGLINPRHWAYLQRQSDAWLPVDKRW